MLRLLKEIASCPNVAAARVNATDPCHQVVLSAEPGRGQVAIPAPWNGSLVTAKLLFLSSNPSFDPNEHYPTQSWPSGDVNDFFVNRFSGGKARYVNTRLRVRLITGAYASSAPNTWTEIQKRTCQAYGRSSIQMGRDSAISEVVRPSLAGPPAPASAGVDLRARGLSAGAVNDLRLASGAAPFVSAADPGDVASQPMGRERARTVCNSSA